MGRCRINIKGNCDDELICHCEGCYNNIESNNIFECAKFGDKFLTSDGSISLLIKNLGKICRMVILDQDDSLFEYRVETNSGKLFQNGKVLDDCPCKLDIVSKYQEPIDEEKLDEFALDYIKQCYGPSYELYRDADDEASLDKLIKEAYVNEIVDFKSGYCKAKKE